MTPEEYVAERKRRTRQALRDGFIFGFAGGVVAVVLVAVAMAILR